MCNRFSFVVCEDGRVLFYEGERDSVEDKHEVIIKRAGLDDTIPLPELKNRAFVRIEVENGEMEDYKVDEEGTLPGWYLKKEEKFQLSIKKILNKTVPLWKLYQKAKAPLFENYQKAIDTLDENYWKARATLDENYWKAIDTLYENYQKARAPLFENYQKAKAPLFENYQKAKAPLFENYQKAIAPAWLEWVDGIKDMDGYCGKKLEGGK